MQTAVADESIVRLFRRFVADSCDAHGVTQPEFYGTAKSRIIVAARLQVFRIARNLWPGLSLPQLGWLFKKDHTAVLYWAKLNDGRVAAPWKKKGVTPPGKKAKAVEA